MGFISLHVNDRYGDVEQKDGKFIFKRGTLDKPIYNGKVYAGVAIVPKMLSSFVLKPPFSTEALFEAATPNLETELCDLDFEFLDYGTPIHI